jgi:hypothetical protein
MPLVFQCLCLQHDDKETTKSTEQAPLYETPQRNAPEVYEGFIKFYLNGFTASNISQTIKRDIFLTRLIYP